MQVGGVFVPPAHRGRGHGGAIVAAQLQELQKTGTQTAILFAANNVAARAYERIGFRHIGTYALAMLEAPLIIKETP